MRDDAFPDYKTKESVVVVYTGEGKGKTSAGVGLMARALGTGWRVAFIQFIKTWDVGEHDFIRKIEPVFSNKLFFYKGGKGFYNAGELSEKDVSAEEHQKAARETFAQALKCATSGKFDLVICDEINNAVYHKLLSEDDVEKLIESRAKGTNLCLTGRNFSDFLVPMADIVTNMTKVRHHFDDKYLANKGIDF
jgi:cob(I)alamin adenosyltransferase